MIYLPLALIALLLLAGSSGAVPVHEWNKTFGGTTLDGANSVQETSDGGFIIAGYTAYNRSCGADCWDTSFTWMIKTDANGNLQWNKTFGGKYDDVAQSVQQTSDGGYILAGHTWLYGDGRYDYDGWLIKTDDAGNQLWNKTYGGTRNDWFKSGEQTKDGGYIITGYTELDGTGDANAWIVKTEAGGIELWNKKFGGSGHHKSNSGELTSDGGYILAGTTQSYGNGNRAWFIKTDANGSEEWIREFGNGSGEPSSVSQTSDGDYIAAGSILSNSAGFIDAWLIKIDTDGNELWNKTFGGKMSDAFRSVQQTKDGGYIIAGETNTDVWLLKTDANGNEEWNMTFGGTLNDWASSARETKDGGYVIAGHTNSYGAGDIDAWLIKISKESSTGTAKTLTAVTAENSTITSTVIPLKKSAGFEVVPAITILLAVYWISRNKK